MADTTTYDLLSDAGVTRLFSAFPDGSLRIVGGAVRNSLIGEAIADVDFATALEPDAVIEALKTADIKHVPTGLDHGTITAVIDGKPYEITSLREDVETDGRRATISYTTDWRVDAERRDFTMNALYMDRGGDVFDPTRQGLEDAEARRLRFVGDADRRVREDYLRSLRYFRFLAWYAGGQAPDDEAVSAIRDNLAGLKTLSAERVWMELKRLLRAPDPVAAVTLMEKTGVLEAILPDANNVEGLAAYVALEQGEKLAVDPMRRLMAMTARLPLPVLTLSRRLKLSNKEEGRLKRWAESETDILALIEPETPERERLAAIYRDGREVIMDRAILRAAGAKDALQRTAFMSLSDLARGWTPPTFPVSGKDLQQAGFAPGKVMGDSLKALEALWIRSGFTVEKPQLIAAARLMGKTE